MSKFNSSNCLQQESLEAHEHNGHHSPAHSRHHGRILSAIISGSQGIACLSCVEILSPEESTRPCITTPQERRYWVCSSSPWDCRYCTCKYTCEGVTSWNVFSLDVLLYYTEGFLPFLQIFYSEFYTKSHENQREVEGDTTEKIYASLLVCIV